MVAGPVEMPVTIPVADPAVANAGTLLLQVPLPVSVSVMVAPTHTADAPPMGAGKALTVILVVTEHPVLRV